MIFFIIFLSSAGSQQMKKNHKKKIQNKLFSKELQTLQVKCFNSLHAGYFFFMIFCRLLEVSRRRNHEKNFKINFLKKKTAG